MVPAIRSPFRKPGSIGTTDGNSRDSDRMPSPTAAASRDPTRLLREMAVLRHDLQVAEDRALLMEKERNNAQYNTRIWQKRVQDQQEVIEERDKAIDTLVNQNLQQVHEHQKLQRSPPGGTPVVDDASAAEVKRLSRAVTKQERTNRMQNDLIQRQNEEI